MTKKVPFSEAFKDKTSRNPKVPKESYQKFGDIPVIDQGKEFIAGFTSADNQMASTRLPVILFGDHTKTVKYVDQPFALGADGVKVLEPQPGFIPKYLYWALKDTCLPDAGYSRHFKFLKEKSFAKPSIDEQLKIVQMRDLQQLIENKRERQQELYRELERSLFIATFGNPVTNSKKLPLVKLGDFGELERGVSKYRPRNSPSILGGPYPLIQTGDVANSGGYVTTYTSTYSELGLQQSKMWPSGTLCITIAANIAKTGILKFDACFPDSIVGFKSTKEKVLYVKYLLDFLQQILEQSAPQSAQRNINLKILRNLTIPSPSEEILQDFFNQINLIRKLDY